MSRTINTAISIFFMIMGTSMLMLSAILCIDNFFISMVFLVFGFIQYFCAYAFEIKGAI